MSFIQTERDGKNKQILNIHKVQIIPPQTNSYNVLDGVISSIHLPDVLWGFTVSYSCGGQWLLHLPDTESLCQIKSPLTGQASIPDSLPLLLSCFCHKTLPQIISWYCFSYLKKIPTYFCMNFTGFIQVSTEPHYLLEYRRREFTSWSLLRLPHIP